MGCTKEPKHEESSKGEAAIVQEAGVPLVMTTYGYYLTTPWGNDNSF
jgi:hypothetical protein